jgi:carboxyl-terminal processing protease
MKKNVGWVILLLLGIKSFAGPSDTTVLRPSPIYGKEARGITLLLESNHYRKIQFNDSMSSKVLDAYLKELDNSKIYFLASDIKAFEGYRYKLDDITKAENVTPAYEIYKVFQFRYRARLNQVINELVGKNFDYTIDEYYETERNKSQWAESKDQLDDVWRKIVKSQALSLKL